MGSYIATKKNEIMLFSEKWLELEIIMFSEIGQSSKDKILHVLSHVELISKKCE
jgi:hypothetical protein